MAQERANTGKPKVRKGLLWFGAIAVVLVALLALQILSGKPLVTTDSRFVVTKDRSLEASPNDNVLERSAGWYWRMRVRAGKMKRPTYSFGARPVQAWSVDALLRQCTDVTGVSYVIPKGVASGTVRFGHTNTLNGSQWIQAVTDILQSENPEWWDESGKLQKGNLVLVTNDAKQILVLTPEMARDYKR